MKHDDSTAAGITLIARLTTPEIVAGRLRVYFGSLLGKIWTTAGIVVPVADWLLGSWNSSLVLWVPFMTLLAIPLGVALAGIKSPEVREMIDRGVGYRLSDAGIYWERAEASGNHGWSLVPRAWETETAFILGAGIAIVILPKRCFQRAEDIDSVREIIRAHVSTAALRG